MSEIFLQAEVKAAVKAAKAAGEFIGASAYEVLLFMPHVDVDKLSRAEYNMAVKFIK